MFANRLLQLRTQKELTQSEVSKCLGIPLTTYANYENNKREPDSQTLIKIADFFNVSLDWLVKGIDSDTETLVNGDPELTEYLETLKNRPELKMMFSLTKDASKADVEKTVKIIEAFLSSENK